MDKGIRKEWHRYGDTRVTARARTLAAFSQLDANRKQIVLRFLREARLINREGRVLEGRTIYPRYVGLGGADLTNADLRGANLEDVELDGAVLDGADLRTFIPEDPDLKPLYTNLRARGLTQKQIEKAHGDNNTQLPENRRRPTKWSERDDQ